MTDLSGPYDRPPGVRHPPVHGRPLEDAPLRHVVHRDEVASYRIADLTGHPRDEGTVWPMIRPDVNGSNDLILGLYRMEPDQYHPRHFHPGGTEFYYIIEGACEMRVGDEDVMVSAGSAIYLPPGTVHSVRTSTDHVLLVYGYNVVSAGTTWLE